MTVPDPALELELEQRFELKADWVAHRELSARVGALEEWQAGEDAVSTWRRNATPIVLSALAIAVTIANVIFAAIRH